MPPPLNAVLPTKTQFSTCKAESDSPVVNSPPPPRKPSAELDRNRVRTMSGLLALAYTAPPLSLATLNARTQFRIVGLLPSTQLIAPLEAQHVATSPLELGWRTRITLESVLESNPS